MPRSVPVAFAIVAGDSRSIAGQIVDAIRREITAGKLAVGDKLPSVRGLAEQLAINPNTVAKAYAELVASGWLQTHAGLGVFVASQRDQLSSAERDRRLDAAVERFINEVVAARCAPDEALQRIRDALSIFTTRRSA